jgi:hypothetical protein
MEPGLPHQGAQRRAAPEPPVAYRRRDRDCAGVVTGVDAVATDLNVKPHATDSRLM